MLQNREGRARARRHVPRPRRTTSGRTSRPRSLRRQDRRRLLAARRLHADLLVDAPAALQRARAGVLRERRRFDRLRVGQRRVRDERMGEGPGMRRTSSSLPGRQRRVHRGHGHARRQDRPGLRQALVALFDAGEGRRRARRCSSSRRRPGDPFEVSDADTMLAYVNPKREEARPGRDPDARRLRLLREGEGAAGRARLRRTPRFRSRTRAAAGSSALSTGEGTVPQVFVNGQRIGGLEALERWARKAA